MDVAARVDGNVLVAGMNLLKGSLKNFYGDLVLRRCARQLCRRAAQLSTDARGAIPHDVQQLVVIDYRAMQNSTAAMNLRNRVMPPELKQFDEALSKFTLKPVGSGKPSQASHRSICGRTGICAVPAHARQRRAADGGHRAGTVSRRRTFWPAFKTQKMKPTMVRTNSIYPMSKNGDGACASSIRRRWSSAARIP